MKFWIEIDLPEKDHEKFMTMMMGFIALLPDMELKYHDNPTKKEIDTSRLKEFLHGILNDPQFSRSVKFNSDDEYQLYVQLAAAVKAPITGRKF